MTSYRSHGEVPRKRHTQLWRDGRLLTEEVVGLDGFRGPSATLYHLHSPMRLLRVGAFRPILRDAWVPEVHVHHRFDSLPLEPGGDALSARRLLVWNEDVEVSLARPDRAMERFFRNGEGDELIFVHEGTGVVDTILGELSYRQGDYVVIPRGITYRFRPDPGPQRHLVITSPGMIEVPDRYRNGIGQLLEHAPYHHRDLHGPRAVDARDETGEFLVTVRVRDGEQDYLVPTHPFDVVAWDGYLYPYTLNVDDLEPIAKQVHAPPSVHETFSGQGFVVASFVPRPLDWHVDAVPIPYNHANLNSEELIYYVDGDFTSRRGIDVASLTLHPTGLTHGPQPGLAEASLGATRTEETAVMLDTFRPLCLSAFAHDLDDPTYPWSWSETGAVAGAADDPVPPR